jgi:phosphate transport system ATP-binding protein
MPTSLFRPVASLPLAAHVIFIYMGELVEAGPAQQMFEHAEAERTRAYISGEF